MSISYQSSLFPSIFSVLPQCCVCHKEKEPHLFYKGDYKRLVCITCASKGKHCSKCEKYKLFSQFPTTQSKATNRGGVITYCKPCRNEKRRENYRVKGSTPEAREKERYQILARKYKNFTKADYLRLYDEQGGVCAICGQPETAVKKKGTIAQLAVDHNHETGQVRSLLCFACNSSFGKLKEDPERIRKLLAYAEKWQGTS